MICFIHIIFIIKYSIILTYQSHLWWFVNYSSGCAPGRCHDIIALQWLHNGRDGISNHLRFDCLLNRLFRRRSKKTSKLRFTGLCWGHSPGTGECPSQRAGNAENVSIWWRHRDLPTWANYWLLILGDWCDLLAACWRWLTRLRKIYSKTFSIKCTNWNNSFYSCLYSIHSSQVLIREWTGAAPTTSEWSTILLPCKVRFILEVWW